MTDFCNTLRSISYEINVWISKQPAVKEESITDWFLYELSRRSSKVLYKAFSRHEEAKSTGADWDWVFIFSDGTVRLRVQAKKLFSGVDNYAGLAHSNRHGQQITKLIDSAASINAYPIYAFYTSESLISACERKLFFDSTGVYICGANTVDENFVSVRKKFIQTRLLRSLILYLA